MPTSRDDWLKRSLEHVNDADKLTDAFMRKQQKLYIETYKQATQKIDDLYQYFLANGEISTTKLWEYARWVNIQQDILGRVKGLDNSLNQYLNAHLERIFKDTFGKVTSELGSEIKWGSLNDFQMKQVLSQNWSGLHYSDRIWKNTQELAQRIQQQITESVALGRGSDSLKKEIMQQFGVGYSDADRLVRTETMYTLNQAQLASYKAAGVQQYEFLAHIDSTTSEKCTSLNGQIYNLNQAVTGENFPPTHPRCRSTIIPVVNF